MIVKYSGITGVEKIEIWCGNGNKFETCLFEDTLGTYEAECNREAEGSVDFRCISRQDNQGSYGKKYSDIFYKQTESVNRTSHINQTTEEGFEMIVKDSGTIGLQKIEIWCGNGNEFEICLFEERDQQYSRNEKILDARDFNQRVKCLDNTKQGSNACAISSLSCEDIDLRLENVVSDITEN